MKKVIVNIIFIISALQLSGQVNTDSIFNSAILNAQSGKYEKALNEASAVLEIFPDRYDVMVFSANVNAWKGDYTKALTYIKKAYVLNKNNTELYDSWLNILLWSKNYQELIKTAELAEQNKYPNEYNLVLKKAIAYKSLAKYNEGVNLIENHNIYLDSIKLKAVYNEMQMRNRNRAISFYYSIDFIDQNGVKPQHLAYIDYAFKIGRHTLIPRLNFANRFDKNDFQIEADYYHLFKNGHYLYTNYGLGINKELFPEQKAGLEYYVPFLKSYESSLGGRYFYSKNSETFMLTGHISKYYHNFWFSFRPFYVFNETKNALTTVFNTRYYSLNPINYWGVELTYGNSPDERYLVAESPDIYTLTNYRIKIEKNTAIFKYGEIKLSASYAYEEYINNEFRNRLRLEILLKRKF
ncbi:YaiO family outer membrane beta-barrel protein [Ancylomarina sp. 16SWW S1-10-2]|uniref:YaiO family outer membrane beta-barrel protein n=1 Tax=Ancylomarina sp. 16SWW S1-10-2 TaxID=2499681 RepID=UPI0012AE2F56|nr:YaiO family outer membrane beta-barrel protein [Ancylomarina sp. 16SWW S1-10-2]MRT93183.1 YaiO family outer membrane beta-barrel protein [Ancylomarina sp. 16SWW S1-10-2]